MHDFIVGIFCGVCKAKSAGRLNILRAFLMPQAGFLIKNTAVALIVNRPYALSLAYAGVFLSIIQPKIFRC